jgi:hypothetical protein
MVCVECSCERCERAKKEEMDRFKEQMKIEYPDCVKWQNDDYSPCFCVRCLG